MDNTLYSKCEVLSDLYSDYYGMPEWDEFFSMNDLGMFCAVTFVYGCSQPSVVGIDHIDNAYEALCNRLGKDTDTHFSSLDAML